MVFDKDVLEQQIYEQIDYERLEDLSEHLKHEIETIFNSCGLYFRIFSHRAARSLIFLLRGREPSFLA